MFFNVLGWLFSLPDYYCIGANMSSHKAEFSLKNDAPVICIFEFTKYEPPCLDCPESPAHVEIMEIWLDDFEFSEQLIPPEIEYLRNHAESYMAKIQEAILTADRDYDEQKADFDAACQKEDER